MKKWFKREKGSKWSRKEKGAIMPIELRSTRTKAVYFINLTILILIALVCILPVIWLFLTSLKTVKEIYQIPPTLLPEKFDISKIGRVWNKMNFFKYYSNSFLLCGGDIVFDVLVSGLAGYVLSRLRPKGIKCAQMAIFLTMMVPGTVTMVPLFKTFLDLPFLHISLVDSYLPMWIMAGGNTFNMLLFKSAFDSISKEYVEAAQIDGCTNLGIFAKIILPLSLPIIMVVAILDFTGAWGDFLYPYLLIQNKDMYPVAVKIYDLKVSGSGIMVDENMIILFLSIIPPIILFIFFQKQMMNGVSFSGVKG